MKRVFLIKLNDFKQVIVVKQDDESLFYKAKNHNLLRALEECEAFLSNFPEIVWYFEESLDNYKKGRRN